MKIIAAISFIEIGDQLINANTSLDYCFEARGSVHSTIKSFKPGQTRPGPKNTIKGFETLLLFTFKNLKLAKYNII